SSATTRLASGPSASDRRERRRGDGRTRRKRDRRPALRGLRRRADGRDRRLRELRGEQPCGRVPGLSPGAGHRRPLPLLHRGGDRPRHDPRDHVRRPPRARRARMTRPQRLTLLAAILGSGVATIDGSIVNVALPAIERDLGGGLAGQQWVSNAYLLTLGSLILIGGSLGDIYGERRVFAFGVAAFG